MSTIAPADLRCIEVRMTESADGNWIVWLRLPSGRCEQVITVLTEDDARTVMRDVQDALAAAARLYKPVPSDTAWGEGRAAREEKVRRKAKRGGWVSVGERLPEPDVRVLAAIDTGPLPTDWDLAVLYRYQHWCWRGDGGEFPDAGGAEGGWRGRVTHWRPLPPPPGERGGG